MTYTAGSLIEATDYNGFVSTTVGGNVNVIWSTGSGDAGYGQTALSTVSTGGTVTATSWASLVNTLANIGNHQGTAFTSRTAPVAGNTISILTNVGTNLSSFYTNRLNAAASGTEYGVFSGTTSKTTATGSGSTPWTITFTHTVTWANAAAARYFFNSGGLVRWQTGKSSTGTEADDEWNDLAGTLDGAIFISAGTGTQTIAGVSYTGTTKVGGTGTPSILTTTTGFYDLTTTPVNIYRQFADTAPYTGQYINIAANVNDNANPTVLTLTTTWVDPGGSVVGSTDAITGGTATTSPSTTITGTAPTTLVTYRPPSTTYLTASWGTPTIAASVS